MNKLVYVNRNFLKFWIISLLISFSVVLIESQPIQLPYIKDPKVLVDGTITDGEYPISFVDSITGVSLSWVHNGSIMYVGLKSNTTGWISIGFGSVNARMDGSNIIIGAIDGNETQIVDEIGVGHNHFSDISRGGESNIIKAKGTFSSGLSFEFIIPLDSGDSLDQKLTPDANYGFFLAINNESSDFRKYHSAFSETFEVYIEPVPDISEQPRETINFFLLIIVLTPILGYLYWRINRPKVYRFTDIRTRLVFFSKPVFYYHSF